MELNLTLIVANSQVKDFKDIPFGDNAIIFMEDKRKIAVDRNGKRSFYNQIEILGTEEDRKSLTPVDGVFYFVINPVSLYFYDEKWISIVSAQDSTNYVFIGATLPSVGQEQKIYVNSEEKNVSVWNPATSQYDVVANASASISNEDILGLFKIK